MSIEIVQCFLQEIFSHSIFPLKALEMLAEGKKVSEIFEFLETPQEKGFLSGLATRRVLTNTSRLTFFAGIPVDSIE